MKMKLESWQIGAIIGSIIGAIVAITNIEFVVMLQIPTFVFVVIFAIIGAGIGNLKK